jgi:thiopeptide-type bacteriocin biosynthesis protein
MIQNKKKGKDILVHSAFETEDYYMLRVPSKPLNYFNDLSREDEDKLLERFKKETSLREAISVSSPSLYETLLKKMDSILQNKDSKKNRQIISSLMRYALRSCSRPTPFGLFSGVATGKFSDEASLSIKISNTFKKWVRPDMEWLLGIVRILEQNDEVLPYLNVRKNMSLHKVGKRLNIKFMSLHGQSMGNTSKEISVSYTNVLNKILRLTANPILFKKLKGELLNEYSDVDHVVIHNYLKQLVDQELLYTELKPPMNGSDPLDYIDSVLKEVYKLRENDGLTHNLELIGKVQQIKSTIDNCNKKNITNMERELHLLSLDMRRLFKCSTPLQVDSFIRSEQNALPKNLKDEIADVAECLWKLNRDFKNEKMEEYKNKFIETYGVFREIPLMDAISEEKGIGFPKNDDELNQDEKLNKMMYSLDASKQIILNNLVSNAIKQGETEIILTDEILQKISSDNFIGETPDGIDIYAEIINNVSDGYNIVLNPQAGAQGVGKSSGRFLYNDDQLKSEFFKSHQKVRNQNRHLEYVEITYIPPGGRVGNVMQGFTPTEYELNMTGIRNGKVKQVDLNDLFLVATPDRLLIKSRTLNKEIRIIASNMYNYNNSPKLCRFLLELTMSQYANWGLFNWGLLQYNQYLPRVRRNNVILYPQSWRFQDLILKTDTEYRGLTLEDGIKKWLVKWNIPRYVYLTFSDLRLLIDLTNPLHLKELVNEAQKNHQFELQEFIGEFEDRIVESDEGRHVMEVVIPVIRRESTLSSYPNLNIKDSHPRTVKRIIYPGEECLHVKLYGSLGEQEEFICQEMLEFTENLRQLGEIDKWFFIRYLDPDPHIRLRLFGDPYKLNESVIAKVNKFARENIQSGYLKTFTFSPYERELERYGGSGLIEQVEDIFWTDSVVASNLLKFIDQQKQSVFNEKVVAAISIVEMLDSFGLTTEDIHQDIFHESNPNKFMPSFRKNKEGLIKFLNTDDNWSALRGSVGGDDLLSILEPRRTYLKLLANSLKESIHNELIIPQQINILIDSLIHMHCNRLLGPSRLESEVRALIKLTTKSLIHIKNKDASKKELSLNL